MKAWIGKLHAFLELNENEILQGAGRVSKQLADKLALREYDKFREWIAAAQPAHARGCRR